MYEFGLEKYPYSVHPKGIIKTIGILKQDHGESWVTHFWEGFMPKLPSRKSNGDILVSSQYELARISGMLDHKPNKTTLGFSKKMASLSIGEFYSLVDNSLRESGLHSSDITALRMLVDINGGIAHTNPAFLLFSDCLLPAYIRLRGMGLSHYDLTGWKEKQVTRFKSLEGLSKHRPLISRYVELAG